METSNCATTSGVVAGQVVVCSDAINWGLEVGTSNPYGLEF